MADEFLHQLAELSRAFATAGGDTPTKVLEIATQIFQAEGAILWLLNEGQTALERKATYHSESARTKAFEQETGEKNLNFGQGLAGLAWAEGRAKMLQLPAMFAQSSHSSSAQPATSVCTIAFPLIAGSQSIGVLEVVNCNHEICSKDNDDLLQTLCSFLGNVLFAGHIANKLQANQSDAAQSAFKMRLMEDQVRELKTRLSKEHDQSVQNARYHAQFLSKLSRDIRTPLSGITSITELLHRADLPTQQQEYIEIIKESAQTVLNVLEEVVEFNRQETEQFFPSTESSVTGENPQQSDSVHASEQLKNARVLVVNGLLGSAEFIEAYATASGIKCENVSRGQSGITAMKQAIIIGNPFDVVFVERLLPDMDAFEFARLIQNDTGLAKAKLVLVSTFDSAQRDDQALKAGFVEHIAKPMKQQQVISVLSAVLQGRPVEAQEQQPDQERLVQDKVAPAVARGQHMILIAEDNPVNQKVALLQLRELGFFATVVANGREAVDVLKQAEFDAVLMDCQMPEMDGFAATREIREWEKTQGKHVPIIAMTASALSSDREQCIAAGMDDYLSKPVTYEKLDAALSKWVNSDLVKKLAGEKAMQQPSQETQTFAAQQATPVDLPGLSELLGPEEAVEVLHLFVQSSEELISQICDAGERRDTKLLKEAAHTLKGAASSVGCNSIARACLELEQCAREDKWESVPQLNEGLVANFANTKSYIDTLKS